MDKRTYKRCEFIIRAFMSIEKPRPELLAQFHEWLDNGHNSHEKDSVLRKLFHETLSGRYPWAETENVERKIN